jgi:hypothetical protein
MRSATVKLGLASVALVALLGAERLIVAAGGNPRAICPEASSPPMHSIPDAHLPSSLGGLLDEGPSRSSCAIEPKPGDRVRRTVTAFLGEGLSDVAGQLVCELSIAGADWMPLAGAPMTEGCCVWDVSQCLADRSSRVRMRLRGSPDHVVEPTPVGAASPYFDLSTVLHRSILHLVDRAGYPVVVDGEWLWSRRDRVPGETTVFASSEVQLLHLGAADIVLFGASIRPQRIADARKELFVYVDDDIVVTISLVGLPAPPDDCRWMVMTKPVAELTNSLEQLDLPRAMRLTDVPRWAWAEEELVLRLSEPCEIQVMLALYMAGFGPTEPSVLSCGIFERSQEYRIYPTPDGISTQLVRCRNSVQGR